MTLLPEEIAQVHEQADTDGTEQSAHHTLGPGRFQAARGSHIHDGGDSISLLGDVTLTGSRSGGTALVSVIDALKALGATDATTS